MHKNVLVTGATEAFGLKLIESFTDVKEAKEKLTLFAGVKDAEKEGKNLLDLGVKPIHFDLNDPNTFRPALASITSLFLLKPAHSRNLRANFEALLDEARESGIRHLVFVSYDNVTETDGLSSAEMEKMIRKHKITYTIIRPTFLMQDFIKQDWLRKELVEKKQMYLPTGSAKFSFIDERDVATVAANIICHSRKHLKREYDLDNSELLTFKQIASKFGHILGARIKYHPLGVFSFYFAKRKEGFSSKAAFGLVRQFFFGRFKGASENHHLFEKVTEKMPIPFEQFIKENKEALLGAKS